MTDKEFKRLSRYQLIEIIYQLQLRQQELSAENERLTNALEDKRLRISEAGNIAEAALDIHNVLQSAQEAAAMYLEEIRIMREETNEECQRLLEEARAEAQSIVAQVKKPQPTKTPKQNSPSKKKHKKKKSKGKHK